MGKNNIENSLKHFLKKKVKITLGFVVAFIISGTLGFAEDIAEDHFAEHNKNFKIAEKYLKELGSEISEININNDEQQSFVIEKEGDHYKFTLENFIVEGNNLNFSDKILKKEHISIETAGKINGALNLVKNNDAINNIITSNILENNGIAIQSSSGTVQNGEEVVNNGLIVVWDNGQFATKKAINNGIILGNRYAQYGRGLLENYGIIMLNADIGQGSDGGGTANNYGVLIAKERVQAVTSGNGKIYNYGIINGNNGQYLLGSSSVAYNYGIINSENGIGQLIEHAGQTSLNTGSTLKNYGIIEGKYGQAVTYYYNKPTENSTVENNGVIKSTEAGMNITKGATGTNNGIIINDKDKVFISKNLTQSGGGEVEKGTTINNGIIILSQKDNTNNITLEELGLDKNNGIILNKDYELVGNSQGEITEGVTKIKDGDEISSNSKKVYLKDGNSEITQNLSEQNISTVITKDSSVNKPVFSFDVTDKNNKLIIADTNITGYFQKNGTLLDVGNSDLSLLGDTKIIAGKDEVGLDVTAININGLLKKLGNIEITGKITGTGRLQDVATNGEAGKYTSAIELNDIILQNATQEEERYLENGATDNYTEISYSDLTTNKITLDFQRTAEGKDNKITFAGDLLIKGVDGVAIDGRGTEVGGNGKNDITLNFNTNLDDNTVQGDILLGNTDDKIVVEHNGDYTHQINMGEGNDSFTVNGFGQSTTKVSDDNHKELGMFNYNLVGVETITLGGGKSDVDKNINRGWHIGEQASISGVDSATLKLDNTELHVEMNNNYGKGNVTTSLDNLAGEGTDLKITTENNAEVKFTVGDKFNVSQKEFTVATNTDITDADISSAVIFNTEKVGDDVKVTVKEADDYNGQLDNYKGIYDAMLGALSNHDDLREAVNYSNESKLVEMITKANDTAEAFYTTGYAVTKDIIDTYISVTEDFGRKAGKDEWIAYGKYVDSDTEFDGGKSSKGYDGKINGTVGMIEYGVSDVTSYGAVFGQGDTEVDITGGGKLDGDNSYVGAYMKHTTQTGVNLTANVGYTKSDLDLDLATSASSYNMITSGNSDSTALTFALRGTKDYRISDNIRLQPVVSARYSLINQDAVESRDANFRIDEQDVTIFEGTFGGNVIKDFALGNGVLSLSAGAEFVLTEVSKSEDGRYTLYGKDITLLDEEDIADNRVEGHIGAEFIHENGVGVNAKYEMIFTDKGDSDRISAGVSYKF